VKLAAVASFPTGTVAFLFTDIEGSTRLLELLGARYGEVLVAHRRILREAFTAHAGRVVDMEGDASFFVFTGAPRCTQSVRSCLGLHSERSHRG